MLEELAAIKWHEHGNEEVPKWLTMLIHPQPDVYRVAIDQLEVEIVQGGKHFEDTLRGYGISTILASPLPALILPFLIQLLAREDGQAKAGILMLLTTMSQYVAMRYEGAAFIRPAQAIRDQIWRSKTLYISLLTHPDAHTRAGAFGLLGEYREHAPEIIPLLFVHLENESDEPTLARILWFFDTQVLSNTLSEARVAQFVRILTTLAEKDAGLPLRETIAFFLAKYLGVATPASHDAMIIQALLAYSEPTAEGSLIFRHIWNCVITLVRLGKSRGTAIALAVVRQSSDRQVVLSACLGALVLAFNRPELIHEFQLTSSLDVKFEVPTKEIYLIKNTKLDALQTQVLQAMVNKEILWNINTNALKLLGIPARAECINLLEL